MRADQPCTWNIVLQYLAVRGGEVRSALYLEYSLAVSGSEKRGGRPALYMEFILTVSGSERGRG